MLLLTGVGITLLVVLFAYKKQQKNDTDAEYLLLKRGIAFTDTAEWNYMKERAEDYFNTLSLNKTDLKALTGLAGLYIQEARITGNYAYYDKAAMHYINKALAVDSNYFDALTIQALLWLNQHHFSEGLDVAKKLVAINPYNAFVYGLLTDGNVEMGLYDSALQSAQKMMDIRPDIRSYSRVSYIRELFGDDKGAIEAMKMAIESGVPGDENTSWCRVQLGNLLVQTGDTAAAAIQYQNALFQRPQYPYALAGLGRLSAIQNKWEDADSYLEKAIAIHPDNLFKELLADVYNQTGKQKQAASLIQDVINNLSSTSTGEDIQTTGHGHYADKELAYAYLLVNKPTKALDHANREYNRRPLNADVCEMMAWVHYKNNDMTAALKYLPTALKTGSKNPELLAHAGIIYAAANDKVQAKKYMEPVLKQAWLIPADLRQELMQMASTL